MIISTNLPDSAEFVINIMGKEGAVGLYEEAFNSALMDMHSDPTSSIKDGIEKVILNELPREAVDDKELAILTNSITSNVGEVIIDNEELLMVPSIIVKRIGDHNIVVEY